MDNSQNYQKKFPGDGEGSLSILEIRNLLKNQKDRLKDTDPNFDPAQFAFLSGFVSALECVLND
jgi:hypothetical protein